MKHVRHYGIASEPPYVQVYAPVDQLPLWFQQRHPAMSLFARTSLGTEGTAAAIRRELAAIDRDIPVYSVQTMSVYLAQDTEQPRLSVMLLSGLGGLALLLAVIGIYGVVSYSVAQRTQEIGVRMALGATGRDVLRMVVGQAIALVAAGVAVGVGASLALGQPALRGLRARSVDARCDRRGAHGRRHHGQRRARDARHARGSARRAQSGVGGSWLPTSA